MANFGQDFPQGISCLMSDCAATGAVSL